MNDAMPLCSNCYRQPSQMSDICFAARQENLTPEDFCFKYAIELGMNHANRFLCSDCRYILSEVAGAGEQSSE